MDIQKRETFREVRRDIEKSMRAKSTFISNTDCHTDPSYHPGGMAKMLTNDLCSNKNINFSDST